MECVLSAATTGPSPSASVSLSENCNSHLDACRIEPSIRFMETGGNGGIKRKNGER